MYVQIINIESSTLKGLESQTHKPQILALLLYVIVNTT